MRRMPALAVLTLIALVTIESMAQTYPTRPIQVIVPWTAGGGVDAIGRAMAGAMAESLGQQLVVVNRDGAAGTIGTSVVANARPDGYTVAFGPLTPITNAPHLMKDLPYSFDSFTFVCQVFENAFGLAVGAESRFKSIAELVGFIEANPGKLSYGHFGAGSQSHLSMQNILTNRKLSVVEVPYKGDAAILPDLQTGRVDFGSVTVQSMIGRPVRLLGIFADARHPAFPDTPTIAEAGLPSMPPARNGFVVLKSTPADIVRRLESACEAAVKSEVVRITTERLRQPIVHLDRPAFTAKAEDDYRQRGALIKTLGLKPQ